MGKIRDFNCHLSSKSKAGCLMDHDELKMLLETANRAITLEERFDRHLVEIKSDMKEGFAKVGREIKELSEVVHDLEITQVKAESSGIKEWLKYGSFGAGGGGIFFGILKLIGVFKGQ